MPAPDSQSSVPGRAVAVDAPTGLVAHGRVGLAPATPDSSEGTEPDAAHRDVVLLNCPSWARRVRPLAGGGRRSRASGAAGAKRPKLNQDSPGPESGVLPVTP